MEYVINPWWFYLLHIIDALRVLLVATMILLGSATIIVILARHLDGETDFEARFSLKKVIAAIVALAIVLAFMPTSSVVMQMLVARSVTYENIGKLKLEAKGLVDYIVEKSREVSK